MSELEVLSLSPGTLRYATAQIFVFDQPQTLRVPNEYVVAIATSFPMIIFVT